MSEIKFTSIFDNLNLGDSFNKFQKSTTDLVKDAKTSVLTPVSSAVEKLNEGVTLVRETDSKLQQTVSSFKSRTIEQLDGIIGALSGGILNTKDLTSLVRVGPDGITFSKEDLARTVGDKIGFPVSASGGLMGGIASRINTEFQGLTGGYFGDLVDSDGNTFGITKNWRGKLGGGLLDMVGKYTDINDLVDISVTNAFYNTLLDESAGYGMYGSYDKILAMYPRAADGQLALSSAIERAMSNADIESVYAMMKLMEQGTLANAASTYPTMVENLLANYTFPLNITPGDYAGLKAKLLEIIVSFKGDRWWIRKTAFGEALNIGLVNQLSDDVVALLMPASKSDTSSDQFVSLLCAAKMFNENSAVDELRMTFPDAPILITE